MSTLSNSFTDQAAGASGTFSAPIADRKKGRLEITNGISNLDLMGGASAEDLFQAQFSGLIPNLTTRADRVVIRYRPSVVDWFKHGLFGNRHSGSISLNSSVPWELDIHGGVSNLDADLQEIALRSLTLTGGVSQATILLPRPTGTVQIQVASGVSNLKIVRPPDVSAQLRVGGGASQLMFDDQHYGSIGGEIRLTTSEYKSAADRYDIIVGGGVSNLVVRSQA
jgi:hypothetical protein